jgi:hypothetical protein
MTAKQIAKILNKFNDDIIVSAWFFVTNETKAIVLHENVLYLTDDAEFVIDEISAQISADVEDFIIYKEE